MTYVDLKVILGIHRQDVLLCQKAHCPVDGCPTQGGSEAVYMGVHGFGPDIVTELTDGVWTK